ncbi:DUF1579 domain-containing protein [Aureliella helgolandensis]|uniref:DUF1579 domain-containing protein n=1 Tax=Aureliella helgolandensis TaxID=2527968 RepID=A0A518GAU1_9BACT|nr:DUF1579 domain-containing protein [Aureliella helgolandensis]QDV25726.1 hypothetical protein Q31a_40530 [Aureliella helgolandensis]
MFAKPQSEHRWLDQLVGNWDFEHVCQTPDGTKSSTLGQMRCRSLGGMWLVCESNGESEGSEAWSSILTVGFDPALNQYVGTFIASMMANIWHYRGVLEAKNNRLPLESQGPAFDGTGTCNYRDTIAIIDRDHWLFTSEMQLEDTTWQQFMSGNHIRS